MRHIIIGCGPAAIAAAETIWAARPSDKITIISDEAKPLYSRCLISYRLMLSEEIDVSYRSDSFFEKNGILPLLGKRAVRISPDAKVVRLDDGQEIQYDRLLIATGGRSKMPTAKGVDKKGVLGFRTISDLTEIKALLPSTRSAAVLGGGCIGLQVAAGLMVAGVNVTIFIKSPHLLSQVADETVGDIYAGLFRDNGADIVTGAELKSTSGGERVGRILLDTGRKIDCQLVVIGKGVEPNLEIAAEAGIRCEKGIVVNENMMTSVSGIYAAGDVAETVDAATGERTINALWPCASEQGRIAGSNMAGVQKAYEGSLRMNTVEFFGLPMISIGRVKVGEPAYELSIFRDEKRNQYRKLVFEQDRLVGLIMVGEISNAGVLASLIRKRIQLGPVKDELIAGRLDFAKIIGIVQKNRDKFSEESYDETLLTFGIK